MKKTRLLPVLLAGVLCAALFTGCGDDGKVGSNNGSGNNSSGTASDAVSDAGSGAGGVVSDLGEGMSDLGDEISDGIGDLTGEDGHTGSSDRTNDQNDTGENSGGSSDRTDEDRDGALGDPPLNDDSVSALEPVETQKKTAV